MIRSFVILGGGFLLVAAAAYVLTMSWTAPVPRDGTTLVMGRDFLNFWMYGRAAVSPDPARFYDVHAYQSALAVFLGDGYPGQSWSYPPSIMLIAAPFGRMGYLPALLCWTAIGLAAFCVAVRRTIADTRILIALLCAPAAILCVVSGQFALIATAMFAGIFAVMDRRPILAGVLIGLLTLKPQLGFLFPVLLVASGRWKVFSAAAVAALLVAAIAAVLFGTQTWIDYVLKGLPTQNLVLRDPDMLGAPFMPTTFMNLRQTGASYETAMAIQLCFTTIAAAIIFWAYRYRRDADPRWLMALFTAASVFGAPYLLSYDTLPLAFAAIVLLATRPLDETGRRLVQLVYWLPLIQIGLGTWHVPGPALIPVAFAAYIAWRLAGLPASLRYPDMSTPVSRPAL